MTKPEYTADQKRAADYIIEISGIGGGEDPVGFLIASHAAIRAKYDRADVLLRNINDQLGEGIHVALRKGVDGKGSAQAWRAISAMTENGWSDAMSWFRESIGLSDYTRDRAK